MHYGLVIVGHSLGAGTAAILSFLLRPQYPTLRCYAYSPPGGLLRSASADVQPHTVFVFVTPDALKRHLRRNVSVEYKRSRVSEVQFVSASVCA